MNDQIHNRRNERKNKSRVSDALSDTSSFEPDEDLQYSLHYEHSRVSENSQRVEDIKSSVAYSTYIDNASVVQAITIPRPGLGKRKGPRTVKANAGFVESASEYQAITVPRPGLMKKNATSGLIAQNYYNKPNSAPINQQLLGYDENYYGSISASNYEQRLHYEQPPIPPKNHSSAYSNLYQNNSQFNAPQPIFERAREDLSDIGSNYNLMDCKEEKNTKIYPVIGKDKEYNYGCIPVDKKKRLVCLLTTGAIALLLIILTIVFFPRFPDMTVKEITVPPGNSFRLTPVDLKAAVIDFKFNLDMIMRVSVKNINSYHLKVETLRVQSFILANASMINAQKPLPAESLFGRTSPIPFTVDDSNNKGLIGFANREEPLTFLAGEETEFTIPFFVQFAPNKEYGLVNDPSMNEIIQLCLGGDKKRTTTIYYEAKAEIKDLSWSPFQPKLTGQLNINCPFQGDSLTKFIESVKGEATGISAIESNKFAKSPAAAAPNQFTKPLPAQGKKKTTQSIKGSGVSALVASSLIADTNKVAGNLGSKEI